MTDDTINPDDIDAATIALTTPVVEAYEPIDEDADEIYVDPYASQAHLPEEERVWPPVE
jgi:hypothetical protein